MNFEFLKGLKELTYIYENCTNAEKLACSMPIQSVFTSRKCAELLAKLIYLAAHNRQMERMTFADILADQTVREFVHKKSVMDAFHYIRKHGNQAVHGDDNETSRTAIDVLQDLHYVAGETACMLGLIKTYPQFDDAIEENGNVTYTEEQDIDQKARDMFAIYLENHDIMLERERYKKASFEEMIMTSVEGNIEMHEYLSFEHRPKQDAVAAFLQTYLLNLLRIYNERCAAKMPDVSYPVELDVTLVLEHEQIFRSQNEEEFVMAVTKLLPEANAFSVDCRCKGVVREFFSYVDESGDEDIDLIEKDPWWTGSGMLDRMESFKRRERFCYKLSAFYPDSGEFRFEKIENGRSIDVLSQMTDRVEERRLNDEWWSFNMGLYADFDSDRYHSELDRLQDIVRANVPADELVYCEDGWEDGDTQILCNSIQWNTTDLNEVQVFLDALNEILLPIKDDVDADGDGFWVNQDCFAVATWRWTDRGFRVETVHY